MSRRSCALLITCVLALLLQQGWNHLPVRGETRPALEAPPMGQHLTDIMHSLPPTDVELGSMVSLGYPTNGMRDVVFYNEALLPKIYIPIHQTNAALPTSSLEFKVSYLKQIDQMVPPFPKELRPEARWMVDPNDYLEPLVYDPKDQRWSKPNGHAAVGACK